MKVTIRHTPDCPNLAKTAERVREALRGIGEAETSIRLEVVDSQEEAARLAFHGSPSILVDGREVLTEAGAPVALACRVYQTPEGPEGAPSVEQLQDAFAGR